MYIWEKNKTFRDENPLTLWIKISHHQELQTFSICFTFRSSGISERYAALMLEILFQMELFRPWETVFINDLF